MAYVWVAANAWAVGAGALIMSIAAAIYFVAPHQALNRRLGLMLLAQGFGFFASWDAWQMERRANAPSARGQTKPRHREAA